MEWKSVKKLLPSEHYEQSVWGEFFFKKIENEQILFFHEGWGKVAAAGATQYVIDTYKPEVLINLGTCGGIENEVERFQTILVNKTIIYDIKEAMGDSNEAIADYTTEIDLSWLGNELPTAVQKRTILSADKDLQTTEIEFLRRQYSAVVADWESGAIAYVAKRNKSKLIILRGVTDLVSLSRGEAYGDFNLFATRTDSVMENLLNALPKWIKFLKSRN